MRKGIFMAFAFIICGKLMAQLAPDSIYSEQYLKEVIVTARNIVVSDNKIIIFPSRELKKNAHNGFSALALLSVPGLEVDPIEYIVKTRGMNSTLCINGRKVQIDEIRTLNPADIKRIDYYSHYDPSHPEASSVVDFILRHRTNGGQFYTNAKENLGILHGDMIVDQKMYTDKSEFNVQLSGKWSHYKLSRGEESVLDLDMPSVRLRRTSVAEPAPTHANAGSAKLSWLYTTGRDMFQLAAYLNRGHYTGRGIFRQSFSNEQTERFIHDDSHKDHGTPAFQLYYQKQTRNNGIFRTSLYGNYNHTSLNRSYQSTTVAYQSATKEDYYYLNPHLMWGFVIGKHRPFINAIYRYDITKSEYEENGVASKSKLKYGQGRLTLGDNFRLPGTLRLTAQMTGQTVSIDNGAYSTTKFYFTPSIFYDITFSKNISVRGNLSYGTYDPQIRFYNSFEQRIDQYQILKGNPDLRTTRSFSAEMALNCNYKKGMFELFSYYENNADMIYENIMWDDRREAFLHTYLNGGHQQKFILNGTLKINLAQGLACSVSGEYDWYNEECAKTISLHNIVLNTNLTYYHKNFQGKVDFLSPVKYLSRGYEYRRPVTVKMSAGYTWRNWHLDVSATNPFWNSPLEMSYMADKYTTHTKTYAPGLSSNLFVMSIAYRFAYGKRHEFQSIEMDNKTRTGILEQKNRNER